MRTISENLQSVKNVTVLDKISFSNGDRGRTVRKSCFYELGADRATVFGAYSSGKESRLIQKIREYAVK